jgi:hypothetical protein
MKRLAALLVILSGAAALYLAKSHGPARSTPSRPWLFVYNAVAHDATLLADPARADGPRVTLDCLELPEWALRVGVHGDELVLLDPKQFSILTLSTSALRRAAEGDAPCSAARPRRVPLHAAQVPYRGLLDGDRLYVSYFSGNLVEVYASTGGAGPGWKLESELRFPASENLGLSDLAVTGGQLAVAATGYFCYSRVCPEGHFRPPRVLFADLHGATHGPFPEARPANINSSGLYLDPSGALFVINSGDYGGGYGSVQRLHPDRTVGPEIRLPRAAAPGSAHALGGGLFAVLQFSGEHLFVVDGAGERLRRILRFDGKGFVDLPLDTAQLPDRSASDLQDVVPDPASPNAFFVVDAKREMLLHVAFDAPSASLRLMSTTPLAGSGFRTSPAWAVWLR